MRNCELLDSYRDGEMDYSQAEEFRRHLASCRECGKTNEALNSLASIMRHEAFPVTDIADMIARRAFQRISSWDGLLAHWFRPGLAFTTACFSVVLCAFIWFAPESQLNDYIAYETLLDIADVSDPAGELLTVSESDFILTLIQGVNIQ